MTPPTATSPFFSSSGKMRKSCWTTGTSLASRSQWWKEKNPITTTGYPRIFPQDLFFVLEGWLTDTDLVQVFENELGLFLSNRFYVTPAAPTAATGNTSGWPTSIRTSPAAPASPCQVKKTWDFESEVGQSFFANHEPTAAKILDAKDYLLLRYNEWDLPGHDAGLVVYCLNR